MTHNQIYGKTINLVADQVDLGESPLVLPNQDPIATTPLALTHASNLILPLTNAAGSARTDVGIAATLHFTRINNDVYCYAEYGNLATVANAVAAATMTFNETVPIPYRPLSATGARNGIHVIDNNVLVNGAMGITNLGVIAIGVGTGSTAFTNAQPCAVDDQASFGYIGQPL